MHCPRCGQRQNTGKIRFCTKCGLEISDVKDLLSSELSQIKAQKKREIAKARRQGMILIIAGFALILIFAGVREFYPLPKFIALFMLFVMFIGALRMSMPSFFGDNDPANMDNDPPENDFNSDELPSDRVSDKSLPEAEYRQDINFETTRFETGELIQPRSVTEHTTEKLEK